MQDERVDLLFAPTQEEMYPTETQSWVDVPLLGSLLDGASRPGHFRGVATVVSKLFHIVQPDRAFFGQKDAVQVAVLRRMVQDLNFDIELVVCSTVRDRDGLAFSSRNRYLSPEERSAALALPRALEQVKTAIASGLLVTNKLRQLLLEELCHSPAIRVDYAEIVDPETLCNLDRIGSAALIAVAAWVGKTRLIDNALVFPESEAA